MTTEPAGVGPVDEPVGPVCYRINMMEGHDVQPQYRYLDAPAEPWPSFENVPLFAQTAIDSAVAAERERTRALVEQCRAALAEELAAWDIEPPLAHVKDAHDACTAWLERPN